MSRRTLEFLISSKKRRVPTLRTLLRKNYIMDIERPVVLGRNEDDLRQKRNSILSFYVDQRKCQAFVRQKIKHIFLSIEYAQM